MATEASTQQFPRRSEGDAAQSLERFNEFWYPNEGRLDHYPDSTGSGAPASQDRQEPWRAVTARLSGPGGFYNIGNLLGLAVGLGLAVAGAAGHDGVWGALRAYFVGSPGSTALTVAMLVFLWGGEVYHRAWEHGFPPDARLNRLGDFVSGIGALALTVAMVFVGEPLLALTSGTLLAGGKFGSALVRPKSAATAQTAARMFRWSVLLCRIPALLSVLVTLGAILSGLGVETTAAQLIAPATLLVCTLLWAWADVLLFRSTN